MIFNSFQFIWLFPIIFVVYWVSSKLAKNHSKRVANIVLLLISYGLYAQWNVAYTGILFGVTLVTYAFAWWIDDGVMAKKKALIYAGICLAFLPLLVFKYYNFITEAGASALAWIGIDAPPIGLNWVVPLGLSFYTFQAVGYLADVYKQRIRAERNFVDYMLFVAFFPQILCGPISRAEDLLPQIKSKHQFDYGRGVSGLRYIMWGMFLKVVLADRVAIYVDTVYSDPMRFTGTSNLLASFLYSLQIYGDFAGYSFIALGVAKLLGYDIIKNFNRPYFATSVSFFWKRWNISLTKWLTTYVYIPLGGSRKGKVRTYVNIMITFLVSGIWHGANWTFIFWGIIHGAAQCVEKFFGLNKPEERKVYILPRILLTFLIVNFAWIFFRMPTIAEGLEVIRRIFTFGPPYLESVTLTHASFAIVVVLLLEILMEYRMAWFKKYLSCHPVIRWGGYLSLTISVLLFGVLDSGQFIYVSF